MEQRKSYIGSSFSVLAGFGGVGANGEITADQIRGEVLALKTKLVILNLFQDPFLDERGVHRRSARLAARSCDLAERLYLEPMAPCLRIDGF
jgi:hypothetical protein